MTCLAAFCLLTFPQPDASLQGNVAAMARTLAGAGQAPSPSDLKLLAGMDRLNVQSKFIAESLSECLSRLTRPGDAAAAERLSAARSRMSPLFEISADGDSSAGEIRESMKLYSAQSASLNKLAADSTQAVAAERHKLSLRPDSGLRKSISLVLVSALPKSAGIILTAHGSPLEPGRMMRFPDKGSVSLIASPWDPRSIRRSEFAPSQNVEILPSSYESPGNVLEYASLDRKVISRWEMTGEIYRWSVSATPQGSASFVQSSLPQEGSYTIVGRFGSLSAKSPQAQIEGTIAGKVQWKITSTRNGRKTSSTEAYDVKQSFKLIVYTL